MPETAPRPTHRIPHMKTSALSLLLAGLVCHAAQATPVVLPLHIENGVPAVDLTIDGKAQRFLLDTGAQAAMHLSEQVATQVAGLKRTGGKARSMDLTGKVQEADRFLISEMVVNGMKFSNTEGVMLIPWGLSIGAGPAPHKGRSVVGMRFFAGHAVLFDFAANTLEMRDQGEASTPTEPGWQTLPFEYGEDGLIVTLGNARASYRLALDSAANISTIKSKSVDGADKVSACKLDFGPGRSCRQVTLTLADGAPLAPYLMDLPDQFTADGILGSDYFQRFRVFLNLKKRILMVRPNNYAMR